MASSDEKLARIDPVKFRALLDLDDAALIRACLVQLYRASGPGGQHRNKVTSAVRLVHEASGLMVTATERRSQHENRSIAVRRMREAIALVARCPLPETIAWPPNVQVQKGRIRVNERNTAFVHVIALVLDALEAHDGEVREAADAVGLTRSSYTRFIHAHARVWRSAQKIRERHGLCPLRAPG